MTFFFSCKRKKKSILQRQPDWKSDSSARPIDTKSIQIPFQFRHQVNSIGIGVGSEFDKLTVSEGQQSGCALQLGGPGWPTRRVAAVRGHETGKFFCGEGGGVKCHLLGLGQTKQRGQTDRQPSCSSNSKRGGGGSHFASFFLPTNSLKVACKQGLESRRLPFTTCHFLRSTPDSLPCLLLQNNDG